ncbi:HET-domain-containing protein [Annulohypoxylon bovei var. microspora]|nr:HET-domain-containing protein [Annulohypoxylon bovei var. microspora]
MLVDSLARHLNFKHVFTSRSGPVDDDDDDDDDEIEEDEDFEPAEEPYRPPAYPYRELGETDVRLLRIVPGNGTIECLLHQIPLAEVRFFYALSYVWGDATHTETIMLEGRPFLIRRNLYEALHQFRQRPYDIGYPEDYFWADAICINQDDLDERSLQVPRMMDIYHAGHVIVWLGHTRKPPTDSFSKKFIRKTRSSRPQISPDMAIKRLFKKANSMWDDWEPVDDDDNVIVYAEFGDAYAAVLHELANILNRPWFDRVWTIQEACLDTSPEIYIGRHSVRLSNLTDLWKILALEHRFLLLCPGSGRMNSLNKLDDLWRHSIFDGNKNPKKQDMAEVLATLLRVAGKKSCSDPRDQLYGLLGLLRHLNDEEELPEDLTPDYRLSYEYVYWNYAAFLFQSVRDLTLLGCSRNELRNVPSWVPDFRYMSIGTEPIRGEQLRISSDKRTLHIRGCVLGTFRDVLNGCNQEEIWPKRKIVPPGLPARLREFEKYILKPSAVIRDITIEEAFDDLINSMTRIIDADGDESFYQVYRRLIKSTGGKRPWYAKKRTTNIRLKEESIAARLSLPFLLLDDGTILGVKREDAEVKTSDLLCVFEGALFPSLLRPSSENYRFLGQCEAESGPLKQQKFGDDFWTDREMQDFALI